MLKRAVISLIVISIFLAMPAVAKKGASGGCKAKDVVGSYTRIIDGTFLDFDVPKDVHERIYFRQLNINAGGTVHQADSSGPDVMINFGKRSQWSGAWKCRSDGKLLVTVLVALYLPVPIDEYFPGSHEDLALSRNFRTTYLFSVENKNTLKLIQAITRRYDMTEDPSDPNGGTLGDEFIGERFYTRLVPSDADLTP